MVVVIDGTNYVRSIQKANPDGSLTFFCAIEDGIVLRLARGVNLVGNLEHAFAAIRTEIGQPQLVIGCDCVLRKLEMAERGLVNRVEADLSREQRRRFQQLRRAVRRHPREPDAHGYCNRRPLRWLSLHTS